MLLEFLAVDFADEFVVVAVAPLALVLVLVEGDEGDQMVC